jgi:hypothetical protein
MHTLTSTKKLKAISENSVESFDWEKLLRLYVKEWEFEHPEFSGEEGFYKMMNSSGAMIEDSFNNLLMFINYTDMEAVKGHIKNGKVLTLEEYTKISIEELEKLEPGFQAEYNALVEKFNNPELTYKLLHIIIDEAMALKHSRDWYHGLYWNRKK